MKDKKAKNKNNSHFLCQKQLQSHNNAMNFPERNIPREFIKKTIKIN